jgi:demethylmenaquinone methyltransferase/2-methoxy-6-polyprenyl-1,4-benzoquinol methylase
MRFRPAPERAAVAPGSVGDGLHLRQPFPQESLMPVSAPQASKAAQVRAMFGRIASRYDLVNTLMTFGRDRAWQRRVIHRAQPPPGSRLLDVGCGTGGLAHAALRFDPRLQVTAVDFTLEMMRVGRASADVSVPSPVWCGADALALPFPDAVFDAVISGYLLRNVTDIRQALAEQVRVAKPGGRIVGLDTAPPPDDWRRPWILLYLMRVVPLVGRWVSGDRHAYRYLPASTRAFKRPAQIAALMREAGLVQVAWEALMFDTVMIVSGTKPMHAVPRRAAERR